MRGALLDPRLIHMPDFAPGEWLNTNQPLTKEQLYGQVVLVDFWDYTCVNCLRTLPYLVQWHQRYADKGLTVVGVHTPEFKFARLRAQIEAAVAEYNLPYPIFLDNDYETWSRFTAKAWPTRYLVDVDGYVRFKRQGEGYYQDTEKAIQVLLRHRDPNVELPDLLPPLRNEDTPGAICYRPAPELYAGYQGGGLFGGALGNPEGYTPESPVFYEMPDWELREEGHFYVDGVWRAWPESLAFAGRVGGRVMLPYRAATVNVVLSPSADPVETALELRPSDADPIIEVRQDGHYLAPNNAGADVTFKEDGASVVRVTRPRLYQLINNPTYRPHELELKFRATGLALYAFTFTTCVAPYKDSGPSGTFKVR
ncbi:MAG TPA: redoxin domain-containing protein [Anaerolineae bacterium]